MPRNRKPLLSALIIPAVAASLSLLLPVSASPEAASTDATLQGVQSRIKAGKISQPDMEIVAGMITKDPDNAELYVTMAQCYDLIGMRDMAREQYAKAATLDPGRMRVVLERFRQKYRFGDPSEAFLDWVEVRKRFPNDPDVAEYEHCIARIYGTVANAEHSYVDEASHGHTLRSVDSVLSMMESLRGDYPRALRLANYDFEKHQTSDVLLAKAMALNGLKKYPAAVIVAKHGYGRDFFFPGAAENLAEAYVGLGDYQSALQPALVNMSVWPQPFMQAKARKLFAKVVVKVPPQSLDEAMKSRDVDFVRKTNSGADFQVQLAKSLMEAGRMSQAETMLATASKNRELPIDGYMLYARLLESKCSYKDALMVYNTGLQSFPDSTELASSQRGLARRVLNRKNDLALRLKEALHQK